MRPKRLRWTNGRKRKWLPLTEMFDPTNLTEADIREATKHARIMARPTECALNIHRGRGKHDEIL